MSGNFTESVVEDAALAWLEGLGYAVLHGPEIAAGESAAEYSDQNYREVVLERSMPRRLSRSIESVFVVRHVMLSKLISSEFRVMDAKRISGTSV
jgi:hypothetical protein